MPNMASTSRKARKRTINYQEVESDQDIDSEDQDESGEIKSMGSLGVIKRTVGDTYGTKEATKRSKKRSRKAKNTQEEEDKEESTYDSKLLLNMPFDIFAETCSHLEGIDLINLAQVNKSFRRTLLSKAARSIWASRRKADGYPLPDDMTELEMATLVYGRYCQNCAAKHDPWLRDFHFFTRMCGKCSSKLVICSKDLRKSWPDLHPQAKDCVRYKDSEPWVRHAYRIYSIRDLAEVDHELKELEEEDDLILSQIQSLNSRSGTRSRRKSSASLPVADKVTRYVEMRQGWVKEQEKCLQEVETAERARQQRHLVAYTDKRETKKNKLDDICKLLRDTDEWTDEEIACFWDGSWGLAEWAAKDEMPKASPQSDPEAWAVYRLFISRHISIRKERQARWSRQPQVQRYYDEIINEVQLSTDMRIFPDAHAFMSLSSVKLLWQPPQADSSRQALVKAKPAIHEDLYRYVEYVRVKAIRTIIAANREVKTSSLSKDSSNYPSTTYDSTFFALATSQFSYRTPTSFHVWAFPEILEDEDRRGFHVLETGIHLRQIRTIHSMLEAANLDPIIATWDDLVELGECFVWKNGSKRRRKQVYGCQDLLEVVLKRGPSLNKVKAGQVVEIGMKQDESDQEGSGSDDGSQDERSDDEEDEQEEADNEEDEEGSD